MSKTSRRIDLIVGHGELAAIEQRKNVAVVKIDPRSGRSVIEGCGKLHMADAENDGSLNSLRFTEIDQPIDRVI
jgi:hypothetical protein